MCKLFAHEDCWNFIKEFPEEFETFGCGPGGFGDWLVPDTVWGLSIKPACQIHDWYTRFWPGATEEDRYMIDRIFKWNALRIVFKNTDRTWLLKLRLRRVQLYYEMIRKYGGPAFWEERNPDTRYKFLKQEEK